MHMLSLTHAPVLMTVFKTSLQHGRFRRYKAQIQAIH